MRLQHICPTCKNPVKRIKQEIPTKTGITYVYGCGHIERRRDPFMRDKEIFDLSKLAPTLYAELRKRYPRESFAHLIEQEKAEKAEGAAGREEREEKESPKEESSEIPEIPPSIDWLNAVTRDSSFDSLLGTKSAYPYQIDGIKFAERAGFKVLIADAPGLGKTIQAGLLLKRNPELLPALVVAPAGVIGQWQREIQEWAFSGITSTVPLISKYTFVPGFKVYVISRDMFSRAVGKWDKHSQQWTEGPLLSELTKLGFKSIIIDECHSFKDSGSKRTNGLIKFIQTNQQNLKGVIGLSGTPIKNRASEYFPILNMLRPDVFDSETTFKRRFLAQNEKGQYTKLASWNLSYFRSITERFVIRRELHEVLKDLPELTRDFRFIPIEDETVKASYNHTLDLMANFQKSKPDGRLTAIELLGWLAQLRNITGQAKVPAALEYIQDFLDQTEFSIAIGIHHVSVRDTLKYVLDANGYKNVLSLSGEDSPARKDEVMRRFNNGESRVLIINMKAGGEGLNLQHSCSNVLQMELTWNPADEDQFLGRFHRNGQKNPVFAMQFLAEGTIDQWFHELKAAKRKIFHEAISYKNGNDAATIDHESTVTDMLRELADMTLMKRL